MTAHMVDMTTFIKLSMTWYDRGLFTSYTVPGIQLEVLPQGNSFMNTMFSTSDLYACLDMYIVILGLFLLLCVHRVSYFRR